MGAHLLVHWSRTQSTVSLSSGEAELNAMLKCASEGLLLQHLLEEIGIKVALHLKGDSSASHGTLHRMGSGKVKHLETKQLWLQERVQKGFVTISKVPREANWADTLTHPWVQGDIHHFASMGIESG